MFSHYTILFAQLNVSTQEKLAVGLILASAEENVVVADYSRRKLRHVRQLIGEVPARNLKWALDSVTRQALGLDEREGELFGGRRVKDSLFDKDYLEYLSAYSTNLLVVDMPRRIDLPANENTFDLLYASNIDAEGRGNQQREAQNVRFSTLKSRETVREHFRTDARIDRSLDASIRFPVRVDLAGRNDRLTVAKLVATDRPARFIADDAHAFTSLLSQTPAAKHFLVAGEPDRATAPRQHQLWSNLREAFAAQYVDLNEFGRVEEYAREHGVRPLEVSAEEE